MDFIYIYGNSSLDLMILLCSDMHCVAFLIKSKQYNQTQLDSNLKDDQKTYRQHLS